MRAHFGAHGGPDSRDLQFCYAPATRPRIGMSKVTQRPEECWLNRQADAHHRGLLAEIPEEKKEHAMPDDHGGMGGM